MEVKFVFVEVKFLLFSEKYQLSEASEWIVKYRSYKKNFSWWVSSQTLPSPVFFLQQH